MTAKVPIPIFSEGKSFERYLTELECWLELGLLAKNKQGLAVALSLPDKHESKIKDKVFNQMKVADLKKEDGIDNLILLLDKYLGKDELSDQFEKFVSFETYRRTDESITAFIAEFDDRYQKLAKKGITLPPQILAFKLLLQVGLTHEEQMLIKSGVDYKDKATMYEQTQISLKKFKGESSGNLGGSESGDQGTTIKAEPVFMASKYGQRGRGWNKGGYGERSVNYKGASGYSGERSDSYKGASGYSGKPYVYPKSGAGRPKDEDQKVNPMGRDGRRLLCLCCGSYRHLVKSCPDSSERKTYLTYSESVASSDDEPQAEEEVCFLAEGDAHVFLAEAANSAVLDSACSSTVCGDNWMKNYLNSLGEDARGQVTREVSNQTFKFGGGTRLTSKGKYTIPAVMAGKQVKITTDVVDSDIPLLLSKSAMKKARMRLDLENDTAEIMGVPITLNLTESGHYCVPLVPEETVFAVDLANLSDSERLKVLTKFHWQFGHPSAEKLADLLKDAEVWDKAYMNILNKVHSECESCRVFTKTPPRSFVALPMGKFFNDIVCVDLKQWNGGYILHMIDMWSRYTVSTFIRRKLPQVIIDSIMTRWVGIFGTMRGIMSDNGGEFNNEEMRDPGCGFNIERQTAHDSRILASSKWTL